MNAVPGVSTPASQAAGPDTPAAEHHAALVRLAAALTGDLDVAHDLAQDALEAYLRSADRVGQPGPWLRAVVVNRSRTWVRSQVRRRAYLDRWEAWRREEANGPDVADQLAVRGALASLSVDHRAVLVLRYYEDLSVAEIARILRVSEGTVKSRLHRGLRRLKESIVDDRSA